MRNEKILIIGAGLGGLALAQGLVKAGFAVTVFEREESSISRSQGYRISIRTIGMKALSALLPPEKLQPLLLAKVKDVGDGFTCANEAMEPFFTIAQGQDAAIQFLRSELRNLLQEGISIERNKRLIGFEDNTNQVIAHFEDGSSAIGDLLVGCDGSRSAVREFLLSSGLRSVPKVVDCNRVIFGGQIDRTPEWDILLPLNKTGIVRFQGAHSYYMGVCFSERSDRSPTVFWVFSEEIKDPKAPWHQFDQVAIAKHCRQLIEEGLWHENLKKLVYDTPKEAILPPWLVRTTLFPSPDQFPMVPTGRVTLLGDAAHAMPSEKGLGGNHALEDARSLSTILSGVERVISWPQSIEAYEREMFTRAKIAVQESEEAADYFRNLRS